MSSERSVKDLSGPYTKEVVGAKGFEPSTSWSRTRHLNPINALSGVAYGTRSLISPLLVVPNLYLLQWMWPGPNRRPPACKDLLHEESTTYTECDEMLQIATSATISCT